MMKYTKIPPFFRSNFFIGLFDTMGTMLGLSIAGYDVFNISSPAFWPALIVSVTLGMPSPFVVRWLLNKFLGKYKVEENGN
jgi:hypothetical protein